MKHRYESGSLEFIGLFLLRLKNGLVHCWRSIVSFTDISHDDHATVNKILAYQTTLLEEQTELLRDMRRESQEESVKEHAQQPFEDDEKEDSEM